MGGSVGHWKDDFVACPTAPQVVTFFHQEGDTQYLLTERVPGRSASSGFPEEEKPELTRLLAMGLRQIHALSPAGCPGNCRAEMLISATRTWLHSGGFLEEDAQELQDKLLQLDAASLPTEDLVFTHGDYCLPNIMVDGNRLAGSIDWGYAGVGDPYRDFVAAEYSVRRNLEEEYVPQFFKEYGVEPEQEKMAVH